MTAHVLVAGGTGVLGRRIVPLLLARGHAVTVLARDPARAEPLRARGAAVARADVLDRAATLAAVRDAAPDVVMHQLTDLARRSGADNATVRVTGTRNLVDAALAAGVRRIVVQSICWCYAPGTGPATEETPLDTVSTDPARRLTVDAVRAMEAAAAELPEAVVLRNGLLYGPDTWYAPDGDAGVAARDGSLTVSAGITSFVHVDDAAAAAVAALGWPAGAYNVTDDEPASGPEWAPVFRAAAGAAAGPVAGDAVSPASAWSRGAANGRARAAGWAPRHPSWRTGFGAGAAGGGPVRPGSAG
jgi:nucleoside-diphosphate-sugar epimerase